MSSKNQTCEQCNMICKSVAGLKSHQRKCIKSVVVQQVVEQQVVKQTFKCEICQEEFTSQANVDRHQANSQSCHQKKAEQESQNLQEQITYEYKAHTIDINDNEPLSLTYDKNQEDQQDEPLSQTEQDDLKLVFQKTKYYQKFQKILNVMKQNQWYDHATIGGQRNLKKKQKKLQKYNDIIDKAEKKQVVQERKQEFQQQPVISKQQKNKQKKQKEKQQKKRQEQQLSKLKNDLKREGLEMSILNGQVVIENVSQLQDMIGVMEGFDGSFGRKQFKKKKQMLSFLVDQNFKYLKENEALFERAGIKTNQITLLGNNSKTIEVLKGESADDYYDDIDNVLTDPDYYLPPIKVGGRILVNLKDVVNISPLTVSRCFSDCISIIELYQSKYSVTNVYGAIKTRSDKLFSELQEIYKLKDGFVSMDIVRQECQKRNIRWYKYKKGCSKKIDEIGIMIYTNHAIVVLPQTAENASFAEIVQGSYQEEQDLVLQKWVSKSDKIALLDMELTEINVQIEDEKDQDQKKRLQKRRSGIRRKLDFLNRKSYYFMMDFEWTHERSKWTEIKEQYLEDEVEDGAVSTLKKKINVEKHPYAWSFCALSSDKYDKYDKGLNCVESFINYVKKVCEEHCTEKYTQLVFFAHNGFRADLPLIYKALLEKGFYKNSQDLQSKMTKVAVMFDYVCKNGKEVQLKFLDSLQILGPMTLEEAGSNFCKNFQKSKCDHSRIFLDNWEQEWEDQNMEQYVMNDVYVLKEAIQTLSDQNKIDWGFDLVGNETIHTISSKSQKILFRNYYDPEKCPLYKLPDHFDAYCRKAYQGGSCQLFFRGSFKNRHAFSVDFNSHYPACMREKYPVGPYRFKDFGGQLYRGQALQQGIYQIHVKNEKDTFVPLFAIQRYGKLCPMIIQDGRLFKTSVEIEEFYAQGNRQIYLIDGLVSLRSECIFQKFVDDLYELRMQAKKKRDTYPKDDQEWNRYEGLQLSLKLTLNGGYGKFASQLSGVVSQITTNQELIQQIFDNGQLVDLERINDTIYRFTGVIPEKQKYGLQNLQTQYNNIMIAAFVTAYGRVKLNQVQRDLHDIGFQLLYSDTDSVYFCEFEGQPLEEIQQKMEIIEKKWCHKTKIGMCKYEMADDIEYESNRVFTSELFKKEKLEYEQTYGKEYPLKYVFVDQACILSLKTYALKSSHTDIEFIRANGLPRWAVRDQKQSDEKIQQQLQRSQFNCNSRQVIYDDFLEILNGKKLTCNKIVFSQQLKLLQDEKVPMIAQGVYQDGHGKGKDCKYVQKMIDIKTGICYPLVYIGKEEFKEQQEILTNGVRQYPLLDDIYNQYGLKTDEQKNEFKRYNMIVRDDSVNGFIVFEKYSDFVEFYKTEIQQKQSEHYHLLQSRTVCQLYFDLDAKTEIDIKKQKRYGVEHTEEWIIKNLREIFKIPDDIEYEFIDRSKPEKKSFHIRFDINYDYNLIKYLILDSGNLMILSGFLDTKVYGGQMRITQKNEKFLYNPLKVPYMPLNDRKQIQEYENFCKSNKLNNTVVLQNSGIQIDYKDLREFMDDYLIKNNCKAVYKIENVKAYQRTTISRVRIVSGSIYCPTCKRCHEHQCMKITERYNSSSKKCERTVSCYIGYGK